MIMDIGHFESEVDIVDILFSVITKNFLTLQFAKVPGLPKAILCFTFDTDTS